MSEKIKAITPENINELSPNAIAALAGRTNNLDGRFLDAMAENESSFVRCAVAEHPNTTSETLAKMAEANFVISSAVAEHPNTSVETLKMLFKKHDCRRLRSLVVRSPAASEAFLFEIIENSVLNASGDVDYDVAADVVSAQNATLPVLQKLMEKTSVLTRGEMPYNLLCALAKNQNLPDDMQVQIAKLNLPEADRLLAQWQKDRLSNEVCAIFKERLTPFRKRLMEDGLDFYQAMSAKVLVDEEEVARY